MLNRLLKVVLTLLTVIFVPYSVYGSDNVASVMNEKFRSYDASRSVPEAENNNFGILYSKRTSPMIGSSECC